MSWFKAVKVPNCGDLYAKTKLSSGQSQGKNPPRLIQDFESELAVGILGIYAEEDVN